MFSKNVFFFVTIFQIAPKMYHETNIPY